MLPRVFLAIAIVAGLAFIIVGAPAMSLAGDVGLADEDVCASVANDGPEAVRRLEQTGFPHASTSPREVYSLTRSGTTEAVVLIDWTADTAECLPLTYAGTVTASLVMDDNAYGVVVGEIKHLLDTGELSGHVFGNFWTVWWNTNVHIPENPSYESAYEWEIARWTAGRLAEGAV